MCHRLLLPALLLAFCALPAQAQRYSQYGRAAVQSPEVLGMGGAGVALAAPQTGFFYNPAHFGRLGLERPRIGFLGARAGVSTKFFDDLGFFLDDVRPEVENGIEFPLTPAQRDLFDRALEQGARPTVGEAAALLPSLTISTGPTGLGAGLFATNTTAYHFENSGGGVPRIDAFSQVDAMAVVAGGTVLPGGALLPGSSLAVGVAGKYTRRYLTHKRESLIQIDPEAEPLYIFHGSGISFDLGLHLADAVPMIPGQLDLGLAVYDLVGGGFDYETYRVVALTGEEAEDPAEEAALLAALDGRDGAASFRAGTAYRFDHVPGLSGLALALDYASASTSMYDQPFLSKLRLGAQAEVGGLLALRAGISQGYPTVGAGLHTRYFELDYVFYGVEDGRLPGQLQRYNHLVQLQFGLF